MPIKSLGRSSAVAAVGSEVKLDGARRSLGDGPMIGRIAYLNGVARTLCDARYERAAPPRPLPTNGPWTQPPLDPKAAARAVVTKTAASGEGATRLAVKYTNDGDKGVFQARRGAGVFAPVIPSQLADDPHFQKCLLQIGLSLARELLELKPETKF